MSASVPFDQMGVFGPAVTLLFLPPVYKGSLRDVSKLLKKNYYGLSIEHIKASHRKEFCGFVLNRIEQNNFVTPDEIIKTNFFKMMQCTQISPLHERVKKVLVPAMLIQASRFVLTAGITYPDQDKINEWLAHFLESYLNSDQLNDHCNFQELLSENPDISSQRNAIGFALSQTYQSRNLTQKDLNAILQGTSSQPGEFLAQADHPDVVADFVTRYLALFGLAGDYSKMLSDMVRSSLNTSFRKKYFPSSALG